MTIKRKLFISNILMLVIPVILTLLTALFLLFIYMNTLGVNNFTSLNERESFIDSVSDVNEISEKWTIITDNDGIRKDIEFFNKKSDSITLYVYEGNETLFSDIVIPDNDLLKMLLIQNEEMIIIRKNMATYCINNGALTFILIDTNYLMSNVYEGEQDNYVEIIIFAFLILIVIITSRLLSGSVFRSIMKPLNILIDGVHQIRDGNLSYQIEYDGNDEFVNVCSDFNEMAKRLFESVNRQQKDEINRKELIAGISHDLRTPLTSIKAYIEGIEKGLATTPQIRNKYLNTIKMKTDELEHIINQLFTFSKLDIGDFPFYFEKINVGEVLAEYINIILPEYESKGLSIIFQKVMAELYVNIDVVQFHNVLSNILGNSLKYKIKEQGKIHISYLSNNKNVIIELKDDGDGVLEESLEKLFDVFYRCDPSRNNLTSGSGLGLAITAKIIGRFNGIICAKNAKDGGLIIQIVLPLVED